MIGAISTYHDYIGYDNFWLHGFVIGLATFPYAIASGHWWMFGVCVALYTVWMGFWSKVIDLDWLEEFGRYAIIPLGIYLLTL
jgi:hypothetical protein